METTPEVPPIVAQIRPLWKAAKERLGSVEFVSRIVTRVKELKAKYPDTQRRRVYHALIGSTPPEEGIIEEDFPGEDSVVRFLESLAL